MAVTLNGLIQKGGCGTPPVAGVSSRTAQVNYYACLFANGMKGTYNGTNKTYKGLTWSQLYVKLATSVAPYSTMDPKLVAQQLIGISISQGVVAGTGGTVSTLGNTVTDSVKAAIATFGGSTSADAACAFGNWHISLPLGRSVQVPCLIPKTALRATVGVMMFTAAGLIGFAGIAVLTVYGLERTGAGKAVTSSAAAVAKVTPFVG